MHFMKVCFVMQTRIMFWWKIFSLGSFVSLGKRTEPPGRCTGLFE